MTGPASDSLWARMLSGQRRLILLVTVGLALAGAICALVMPRQEDPRFPNRNGLVVFALPGADALRMEREVAEAVEEALVTVPEIQHVKVTARPDVAIVSIQLSETIYDTDPVWDDVQDALDDAARTFPADVLPWALDADLTDLESIVVAVHGSDDRAILRDAAEVAEARLRRVSGVRDVVWTADPGEQVVVTLDESTARSLGMSPGQLAATLSARTAARPGGTVVAGGRRLSLDAATVVSSADALAAMPIVVGTDGAAVPLATLADVREGPIDPDSARMRVDGDVAVALGVVASPGIDVVALGDDVDAVLDALRTEVAPLSLTVVTHQPTRVADRLADLGWSLAQGVFVVAGVLIVAMGLRLGSVVAIVVPVVTLASLALYAAAGGILQQISIAALVLSLGLLVDNAIVVAEQVQRRIDEGDAPWDAAIATVQTLALPLASATGTTVASFLPLLLSKGTSGDFTRAIPQLVILTLIVSFGVAVSFTPVVAALTFRPRPVRVPSPRWARWTALWSRVTRWPVTHPGLVVAGALGMVVVAVSLAPLVPRQFFPSGDRNQLVVEVELAEGTHLDTTDTAVKVLEASLVGHEAVDQVATFVGRSTPAFYYNLPRKPDASQLGQLLVRTSTAADVEPLQDWIRERAQQALPGVTVVTRRLEQGPPAAAPVELRLAGEDLAALWAGANELHALLRATHGTVDVRHDLGAGTPALDLHPSNAALARRGLSRDDVALAVLGRTRGLPAGVVRRDGDTIPIVVRDAAGEMLSTDRLDTIDLWSPDAGPVPLAAVARPELSIRPGVVRRRDGHRRVSVMAQLRPGTTFSEVMSAARGPAERIASAHGLTLSVGGEAESSGEANQSIFVAAPVGTAVLLAFLLAQFRSVRKVGIVLLTVPLAATGVVPGLWLSGQPMGFTSLLGLFALVGIVVNNAIILIDAVDARRADGMDLDDALLGAVAERTRPILLTTVTTMVGMAPLLVSDSTLWPPLAAALMSGLAASTGLTLLVIPAAYRLVFGPRPQWPRFRPAPVAVVAAMLAMVGATAQAAPVTLDDAVSSALQRNLDLAAAGAVGDAAKARSREAVAAVLPGVQVQAGYTRNQAAQTLDFSDDLAALDLPGPSDFEPLFAAFHDPDQVAAVFSQVEDPATPTIDPIVVRPEAFRDVRAGVGWTFVDAAAWTRIGAARSAAQAARLDVDHAVLQVHVGVVETFYGAVVADAAVTVAEQAMAHAEAVRAEAHRRVAVGNGMPLDALEGDLALSRARSELAEARSVRQSARLALADVTGLPADSELVAPDAVPSASTDRTAPVDQHPAVRAAAMRAETARQQAAAERRSALPTLDAFYEWSWTENQGFQPDPTFWVAGVTATWTPVEGGRRWFASRGRAADARAADALAAQVRRRAEHAVLDTDTQVARARDVLLARAAEVDLAREGARLSEAALQAGTRDVLSASASRLSAAQAGLGWQQAAAALAVAEARYRAAVGR